MAPKVDPAIKEIVLKYTAFLSVDDLKSLHFPCPDPDIEGNYHIAIVSYQPRNAGTVFIICCGPKDSPKCDMHRRRASIQLSRKLATACREEVQAYLQHVPIASSTTPAKRRVTQARAGAVIANKGVKRKMSDKQVPKATHVDVDDYIFYEVGFTFARHKSLLLVLQVNHHALYLKGDGTRSSPDGQITFILDLQPDILDTLVDMRVDVNNLELYDLTDHHFTDEYPPTYAHIIPRTHVMIYRVKMIKRFECPGLTNLLVDNLPPSPSPTHSSSNSSPLALYGTVTSGGDVSRGMKRRASHAARGDTAGMKRARVSPNAFASSSSLSPPSQNVVCSFDFTGDFFDENLDEAEFLEVLDLFKCDEKVDMKGKGKNRASAIDVDKLF
ncbi:hypothetical protein BD410DRAFT_843488 [Rickenella mellea]|uniref:Uncharacterized protein n=1 Tax=Rickenella mellea TaxID=50990 RepID=A0A4Y7PSL7_9AGAM|nr:hypothetical protein BD410DRAFT_843488 [Rickenella mellea]